MGDDGPSGDALVLTDSVHEVRDTYDHGSHVLILDNYDHCQHALGILHKNGAMFREIRVVVHNQHILLALLDAEILSRLMYPSGILRVTTPVRNHYLIHQVSIRLKQTKCVHVHEVLSAPLTTFAASVHDAALVYMVHTIESICRYVPFSSRFLSYARWTFRTYL